MIAVIADDLTGAAEIAGIGWRHGLDAKILHRDEPPSSAGLLVYDSDSRNCTPAEARRRVTRIVKRLQTKNPAWIFKKVDSVLRGNALAETEAAMRALKLPRGILVSANPSAGRVVRDGKYFIHGRPIHKTDFRHDPRHPRRSPRVVDLLGGQGRLPLAVVKPTASAPSEGIIVGDAADVADVRRWAVAVDARTFAAGGAEFFSALLANCGLKTRARRKSFSAGRTLFVCGSLAESAAEFLRRSRAKNWPVLLMPGGLVAKGRGAKRLQDEWAQRSVVALRQNPQVVVAIGRPMVSGARTPGRLGEILTDVAARILSAARPRYACVEGGATAAVLLQKLGWTLLTVDGELATGVVVLKPRGGKLSLVLKPGSYEWPRDLAA